MNERRKPPSDAPVSVPNSENTPSEEPKEVREPEATPPTRHAQRRIAPAELPAELRTILREQTNLRAAVNAVLDRSEEQSRLLETVTNAMQDGLKELRETLDALGQVIGNQDDQLDKLADVTDALIQATQTLQALNS